MQFQHSNVTRAELYFKYSLRITWQVLDSGESPDRTKCIQDPSSSVLSSAAIENGAESTHGTVHCYLSTERTVLPDIQYQGPDTFLSDATVHVLDR
jgi:hypothetical protein